ncbi:hypothetical protein CRG98_032161 [Punica granatum]|uniref:Disease resistance protein Roq1-like winged-helix domain-containing protein n=1 Tax=Punica granatum TaxID=22663 RepID=A0A2I0ITW4_PUNGR|nr:hypothetical protein CRG98_032161 [Punica granatum]
MVQQWEDALREAGKIKGWELKDKGYGEFARFFAREVSMKLKVKHKCVTDYLVQRDDQVEALMKLLDIESSDIFLDIACFFINYDRKYPTYMWEACDFDPKMGLKVLVHMSLLRDLGRKIVADERFKDVMKCSSRLWMPEDALKVLREEEDKENIEMLRIHYDDSYGYTFNPKELSSLRKLRYLECWSANFSGHPKHFLPKLMWLSWRSHPRDFMGTDLYLRNIVILDLSWSTISETWGGWNQIWVK